MTIKKKAPQDLTLRNLRAMKKRLTAIEQHMDWLVGVLGDLRTVVKELQRTAVTTDLAPLRSRKK